MKQQITNIKNCESCPHWDHSGAFTQGGAIPLCRAVPGLGDKADRWPDQYSSVLPFDAVIEGGFPERHGTGVIPDWCPLPDAP